MPFPSDFRYASFFNYSPYGKLRASVSSQRIRVAIKRDGNMQLVKDGRTVEINAIEAAARAIMTATERHPFLRNYLNAKFSLVPVPRSSLTDKTSLWPTKRICEELVKVGLGAEVSPFLKRIRPVQKASTAPKGQRPTPEDHFNSTSIDNDVPTLIARPLVMVDDIVTQGSSFVGMYAKLKEAFPGRQVLCFSLMQTQSEGEIESVDAPGQGTIYYNEYSGKARRVHDVSDSENQRQLL